MQRRCYVLGLDVQQSEEDDHVLTAESTPCWFLTMMQFAVASVVAFAAGATLYLARQGDEGNAPSNAYILENTITHARLLPEPSAHAFSYPTLAFFLSLDALESHSLDLVGGWLFGYGGVSWRVTGLRSSAYLLPDSRTGRKQRPQNIKEKLREVLVQHGHDGDELGHVWMLTMPSYMEIGRAHV